AIVVVIEPGCAHTRTDVLDSGACGEITEVAVAVDVKILSSEIIGDEEIGPAVIIEIAPGGRETEPVVVFVHAGFGSAVIERAAAVRLEIVAKQKIRRPVLRVLVGRGVGVLGFALKIDVAAEIKVQLAVAIEIGGCHSGKSSGRGSCETKGILANFEPAAFIQEENRSGGTQHDKILPAGVAEIKEERAGSIVEDADAPGLRYILEIAAGMVSVKPVGEAARLADVDLVYAVAVDIPYRDAVAAIHIDAAGGVETSAPVGDSFRELFGKRWGLLEYGRGHIAKKRSIGGG